MTPQDEMLRLLQEIFDWKYNSLASYILQAEPYIPHGHEPLVDIIRIAAERDKAITDQTAAVIRNLRGVPHVNPPHQSLAELNFLSIDFLCTRLQAELEKQQKRLSLESGQARQSPEVGNLVSAVMEANNSLLESLKSAL